MSSVLAPEQRAPYLGPHGPWGRGSAAVSALLAAGSLASLALAWVGASGETRMSDVVPWLVLAVTAFAVGGLAGATWLGRGLRSIRTERVALRRRLLAMDVGTQTTTEVAYDTWVMAPGMTRVHRRDCEYVRGKAVREVSPDAAPACVVCTEVQR